MTDADRPRVLEGSEWRRSWDRAEPAVRARVAESVGSGRAVTDAHEAALAVGLAVERRKMATYGVVAAAAVAVVIIGFGTRDTANMAIAALALLPLGGAAWAHSRRAVFLKAEFHNRDVVYEALARTKPPPPPEPVADPWADAPPPPPPEPPPGPPEQAG